MGGKRIFHDADNERTQPLDICALGGIDALLLCPWAGSGAGAFLPPLVSPVPEGVVALRGGESLEV
jgi:hypothetical protein